ncbi:MAG: extracellular solute-binding protein [Firmicutes bacterium]|nr:extracellular solute-binding protein [Bacillota bacterium]
MKKASYILILSCMLVVSCVSLVMAQVVLEFAHSTVGGSSRDALTQIIKDFEEANPGIRIKENAMKDEIYETVGLLSLFQGGTPPDVYSQWGGWLVRRDAAEGFAADLTEEFFKDSWKDAFVDSAWPDSMVGDRIYMVPESLSITNLIWYNKEIFDRFGLKEPGTWDEFLEICEVLKQNGIVPIAAGNKGVGWPMGNWAGHILSRVIGEVEYNGLLKLEAGTSFTDPGVVTALELLAEMVEKGYFNMGVNVIDSNEAQMMFFMEQAAMHPIGSWLIPSAIRDAPDLVYGGFDTPAISGGKGDQSSMIGLTTGYLVGAKTAHFEEAVSFLRYLTSVPVQRYVVQETGGLSAVKGTEDAAVDPNFSTLVRISEKAKMTVAPPDTGYELEVAYALYDAVAKVMDGISPTVALEEAEQAIAHLR